MSSFKTFEDVEEPQFYFLIIIIDIFNFTNFNNNINSKGVLFYMLSQEEYQKIVDRLISILGKNINIIDTNGIIIASGDSSRIGNLHEAGKIAAKRMQEIIIDDNNLHKYKGVKKGVNIPLCHNDEVIGVVGITGEPQEVVGYGKIIKELVELMIQEYERKKYELFHSRAVSGFAKELFKKSDFDVEEINIIKNRAKLVGFDFSIPKTVIIADIIGFSSYIAENNLSELAVQELKQNIVDFIKTNSYKNDVVFNLNEDRFIILKEGKKIKEFCIKLEKAIFNKFKLKMIFAIGHRCDQVNDYFSSYTVANKLITIGKRVNKQVLSEEDYKIQIIFDNIPKEDKEYYLKNYEHIIKNTAPNTNELLRTIKTYFESNMNLKETSNKLFVHKNTVIYRINKFKELYGINITEPFECMKLYIAILLSGQIP